MIVKKCLTIALLMTLSATALAVKSEPDNNVISIPVLKPGAIVNIAAVWLQPGASNLNYVIYNKELPAQSPTWLEKELNPNYDAGFTLGVQFPFQATGRDIGVNWTHVSTNKSATTVADNASYFLGPDYEIGPAGIPIRNATGNVKFDYDVINVDVGQYLQFGQRVQMRFFGGLSAGLLKEEVVATYTGTRIEDFPGPFSMRQDVTSNFNGVGPRFGIRADYQATPCFGIFGEGAASALIGSVTSTTNFTGSGQQLMDQFGQSINYQFIKDQRVYQVVPAIDTKLGISFRHQFRGERIFTLKAGYQAAVYINAISQYLPASLVSTPPSPLESGGIFVATMSHTLSNYSVQGPFLDFALQF